MKEYQVDSPEIELCELCRQEIVNDGVWLMKDGRIDKMRHARCHAQKMDAQNQALAAENRELRELVGEVAEKERIRLWKELGTMKWLGADEGWDKAIEAVREFLVKESKTLYEHLSLPKAALLPRLEKAGEEEG